MPSEKNFGNCWIFLHSQDGPGGLTRGRTPADTAVTLGPFRASERQSSSEQMEPSMVQLCSSQPAPVFPFPYWFLILCFILKCQTTIPQTYKFQSTAFAHNTFLEHWAKKMKASSDLPTGNYLCLPSSTSPESCFHCNVSGDVSKEHGAICSGVPDSVLWWCHSFMTSVLVLFFSAPLSLVTFLPDSCLYTFFLVMYRLVVCTWFFSPGTLAPTHREHQGNTARTFYRPKGPLSHHSLPRVNEIFIYWDEVDGMKYYRLW